jgi:glycosyltransferase involved in cell wall biosynthesis
MDAIKREIKILSIHWGFSLGGIGKYALLIDGVRGIQPINIKTLCILGKNWSYDHSALERLQAQKIFITSRFDLSWLWQVSKSVKKLQPDLIMTHGFNGHFVAMATQRFSKHQIPFICSYHGSYHAKTRSREYVEGLLNRLTEYFIRRRVLSAVSVSEYSKRYLIEKGIAPEKVTVVHNGLEAIMPAAAGAREKLRKEWDISDEEIFIGVASRLDPVKGIGYLVRAFSILIQEYPQARLVIIGTGTIEDDLKKYVEELGIADRVIFTGFRSDIVNCLEALDIFSLPSLAEYHSIGLLEAMRAAKAIVATSVGGNTESVRHEKEGLIVPAADSDALAKALERLITDIPLRTMLEQNARNRFEKHFTAEALVKKTAGWMIECGGKCCAK